MLESKVNQKNTHAAIAASANPFEFDPFTALDEMPDPMEPRTPFPGRSAIESEFDAEVLYARRAAENGNRLPELSRLETKFNLTIIAILSRKRVNGHLRTICLCSDSSEITCNLSTEAARTLEPSTDLAWKPRYSRVRFGDRVRNFGFLEQASEFAAELDPELKPVIVDMNTGEVIDEEVEAHGDGADGGTPKRSLVGLHEKVSPVRSMTKWNQRAESGDWLDKLVSKHHPEAVCNGNGGKKAEGVLTKRQMESHCGQTAERLSVRLSATSPKAEPVRSSTAKGQKTLTPENIETSRCSLCGRVLTNPLSCALEIGPECRKKVHKFGAKYLDETALSDELVEASKLWEDEKFQKWIIKGGLALGASLPAEVVCQPSGTQYWGVKSWPHIYYKDSHGILNVINYDSRKLKYRAIDLRSMQTPLDQMVQRRVDELAENGGKEVRTICI